MVIIIVVCFERITALLQLYICNMYIILEQSVYLYSLELFGATSRKSRTKQNWKRAHWATAWPMPIQFATLFHFFFGSFSMLHWNLHCSFFLRIQYHKNVDSMWKCWLFECIFISGVRALRDEGEPANIVEFRASSHSWLHIVYRCSVPTSLLSLFYSLSRALLLTMSATIIRSNKELFNKDFHCIKLDCKLIQLVVFARDDFIR